MNMQLEELRKAYRSTWLAWARETDALQQVLETANPSSQLMEKSLSAVERARAAHNEVRDRLALVLGHTPESVDGSTLVDAPGDARVRTTARLLWDLSGRPRGTADSDWTSAQGMVRTAATAGTQR